VVICTINTLVLIVYFTVVAAGSTTFVTCLTSFVGCAVGCVAQFTSGSASYGTVQVGHQVLWIIKAGPTGDTLRTLKWVTGLAGVFAQELGSQDEIVELVHNVGLAFIPVSLNHKTITWSVINSILHIHQLNIDLSTEEAGSARENVSDGNCLRVGVHITVLGENTIDGCYLADGLSSVDQSDLLGVGHLNTAGRWDCVVRRKLNMIISY